MGQNPNPEMVQTSCRRCREPMTVEAAVVEEMEWKGKSLHCQICKEEVA